MGYRNAASPTDDFSCESNDDYCYPLNAYGCNADHTQCVPAPLSPPAPPPSPSPPPSPPPTDFVHCADEHSGGTGNQCVTTDHDACGKNLANGTYTVEVVFGAPRPAITCRIVAASHS